MFEPIVLCVEYVDIPTTNCTSYIGDHCDDNHLLYWLYDLLESERKYKNSLELMLEVTDRAGTYSTCAESKIIAQLVRPIYNTSCRFIRQIEYLLSHWKFCINRRSPVNCVELAALFGNDLWSTYDSYHFGFLRAFRRIFKRRKRSNEEFQRLLTQIKCKTGQSLDNLLLLPEERVLAYHNQLKNFCRTHSLDPPKDLIETVSNLEETGALESRLQQIASVKNEYSSQAVLDCDSTSEQTDMMVRFHQRRSKSCGGVSEIGYLSSDPLWYETDDMIAPRYQNQKQADEKFVRTYIKESRVHLGTGVQSQERYLFLFSDLLLIAKEKGSSSYKLKEKIRIRELWLRSGGIEEVAECVHFPEKSFVIGWPTVNYVAEFGSVEERNSWFELLEKTLNDEKDRERPKVTTISVHYKTLKNSETRRITLNNYQTARDFVRLALIEFDLNEDISYQLWVHSAKENAPYPLYGHECPFAIFMSHVRDFLPDEGQHLSLRELEDLASMPISNKCKFVLRPRSQSAAPSTRKARLRRAAPGHLYSQIKKKLSKSDSGDSGVPTSPSGQLFGHSLHSLTDDNSVPKPILYLLSHIFTEGVFVEGIFRKSPKQSTVKQLREVFDSGEDIMIESPLNPLVSASLLKEFLRNLPNKLLINDMYFEWIGVCDEPDESKKLLSIRKLLSQLPPANYQLLRHLLCVLHHVAGYKSINQMTSQSLSVCIGPSLLEKPSGKLNGMDIQDSVRRIPQLAQMLIDHIQDLFGADTTCLFGTPPEKKTTLPCAVKQDSTEEESDALGQLRQETSSVDSLAASSGSPDASRPHSSSLMNHPANVSRDSGLSEAHYLTDDSMHQSLCTTVSIQPLHSKRTYSTGDEDHLVTIVTTAKSVENLTVRQPLPEIEIVRDRAISTLDRRSAPDRSSLMTQSWHATMMDDENENEIEVENNKRNKYSPDSLYQSQESNIGDSKTSPRLAPLRASRRLELGTLHRSESGEHLVFSEATDDNKLRPLSATEVLSLPVFHETPRSPVISKSGESSPDSGVSEKSPGPTYMTRESMYRRPARPKKGLQSQRSKSPDLTNFDDPNERKLTDSDSGRLVITCNRELLKSTDNDNAHWPLTQTGHSEASSSGASSLSSLVSTDSESYSHRILTSTPAFRNRLPPPTFRSTSLRTATDGDRKTETCAADSSSTVTETSSDEDATPVVSRETSRAQEYQAKVREMFAPTTSVSTVTFSPIQKADFVKRPYASSSLLTARPQYSWETKSQPASIISSFSNVRQNSVYSKPIAAVPAVIRSTSTTSTSQNMTSPEKSSLMFRSSEADKKPPPPTYEETMRRQSLRGEETAVEIMTARERLSGEIGRKISNTERPSVINTPLGKIAPESPEKTSPVKPVNIPVLPGQVREQVRRYNGKKDGRNRRKTLGDDDYRTLSELNAQINDELKNGTSPTPKLPMRMASCDKLYKESVYSTPTRVEPSRSEISWSVNRLRSMFDERREHNPTIVSTNHGLLERSRTEHEPQHRHYNSASALTTAGLVRFSDSQANYPVVKPPPLQTYHESHLPLRLAKISGRSPTTPTSCGMVRALASNFENCAKPPESYV